MDAAVTTLAIERDEAHRLSTSERHPGRYVNIAEARARHGDRVDRLGPKFFEVDPVADAAATALACFPRAEREALIERTLDGRRDGDAEAPPALRALVESVTRVPFWVDDARLARGGAAFLRAGLLGGMVLGACSLILGYCSPAGNKPLVLSGRLEADGARRLAETSRFVQAVTSPNGMRVGGDGFKITVRVRLMHAAVRRMILQSGAWNLSEWGAPINQVDMAGTILLFSLVLQDGLEKLGLRLSTDEREDMLHLWRYVAYVIGVCDELRFGTLAEARTLWDLISTTQAPPDDDARALARALLEGPVRSARTEEERLRAERSRPVAYAVARHLLGEPMADALALPRSPALYGVRAFARVNLRASGLIHALPRLPFGTVQAGARYWDTVVRAALGGEPASFAMPERMGRPSKEGKEG